MKLAGFNIRNVLNGIYILANSRAFKNNQYLQPDYLIKIRNNKLKKILRVAIEDVPYYSFLKGEIDFDNFKFEDLKKFPVIDKKIIRDNYDKFLVKQYKSSRLEYKATSGSSGEPFKVPKAYYSDAIEQCMMFRAWSMNPSYEYNFRDPCIVLRSFSPEPGKSLFKIDKILNYWYLSPFDISDKTIHFYFDLIIKSKAKLLRAYPSSLYILTLYLEKYGLRIPQIKTLFTSSENLLPLYRKKIESYWNIPLIDWYGQNERTATVQMCEFGVYHNNDEYGIIELDGKNQIIATSLNNNIMPLIRYATNDIAVPSSHNKCLCGRGLSIPFSAIDGRADDLLVKDDGSIIPTVNIYNAMELFQDVRQFRIIQNESRSILIEIVVSDFFKSDMLKSIKYEISKRVGNLEVSINVVDKIERDRITGKVKAIISKAKYKI